MRVLRTWQGWRVENRRNRRGFSHRIGQAISEEREGFVASVQIISGVIVTVGQATAR